MRAQLFICTVWRAANKGIMSVDIIFFFTVVAYE